MGEGGGGVEPRFFLPLSWTTKTILSKDNIYIVLVAAGRCGCLPTKR